MKAVINKILPFSSVDGPGNRTAIFFQGCNFNCEYCHNPETIDLCSSCRKCIEVCPTNALKIRNNYIEWIKRKCIECDSCIKYCPNNSSPKVVYMSPIVLANTIKENIPFIRGITCSGGECTIQYEFIENLFFLTRKMGLTNILDTNGTLDFSKHRKLLNLTDGVILDVKSFDDEVHKKVTGYSNEIVLKNAVFLAKQGKLIEIRTVIIEKYLKNEETVYKITKLLAPLLEYGDINYRIIKYRPIGVRREFNNFNIPSNKYMEELKFIALKNGFKSVVIT